MTDGVEEAKDLVKTQERSEDMSWSGDQMWGLVVTKSVDQAATFRMNNSSCKLFSSEV